MRQGYGCLRQNRAFAASVSHGERLEREGWHKIGRAGRYRPRRDGLIGAAATGGVTGAVAVEPLFSWIEMDTRSTTLPIAVKNLLGSALPKSLRELRAKAVNS